MILALCWTVLLYGIVNSMATLSPVRTLHVSPLHAKEFFYFKKAIKNQTEKKNDCRTVGELMLVNINCDIILCLKCDEIFGGIRAKSKLWGSY